tara:strand:+ start:177 stop:611 length:435 start_codon:yes stop_codon:yes gene_type:complete
LKLQNNSEKKNSTTKKDREDWVEFIKEPKNIYNKDENSAEKIITGNSIKKLDLHGFSLEDANKEVKKFIINSFDKNYKKLLIVTGKGSRSKTYENPYASKEMSILKNSIPEYLKKDKELSNKILKISTANKNDGGEGALYIFLK